VDLSPFAGKTIDHWTFNTDTSTSPGSWNIYYQDVAMFSADGTVRPIYNRQKTISLSVNAYPGMTGVGYEVNHWTLNGSGGGVSWLTTTNYYHGDHLGSSRQMTTVNGYPTWSSTFLPFGQEWNPQITVNNYKFTGDERDAESQLDHTWFRQNSSSLARWTSPDPADLAAADPTNPQSWNRYNYVTNSPPNFLDPSGLQGAPDCSHAPNPRLCGFSYYGGYDGNFFTSTVDIFDLIDLALTPTGSIDWMLVQP
jgi:RHS repeat-associated protein